MSMVQINHDRQQDLPVAECDKCRGEIYREETMYQWEGLWMCPECFESVIQAWMKDDLRGLALALNVDMEVQI